MVTTPGLRRHSCAHWVRGTTAMSPPGPDDHLVGYAGIARLGRTPPFEYEIHTIGVDPAYQGHGIGRAMMAELLEFVDPPGVIFLEVRTDNAPAIALYTSLGFVTVGLRKRYYRASGADAFTMRRDPP